MEFCNIIQKICIISNIITSALPAWRLHFHVNGCFCLWEVEIRLLISDKLGKPKIKTLLIPQFGINHSYLDREVPMINSRERKWWRAAQVQRLFCALASFFGCSHPTPYAPSPGVFAQETGKRRPHTSNRRLAHYDGEKTQAMSQTKFIYVNIHTFLSTNLCNLVPQTFALLCIQYKITRDSFDTSTLTLEQKLRDDALHI